VNTKRHKRWNGDATNLSAAYLENVIEKMQCYGNNAQFSINGTTHGPNYRVMNAAGKKIVFNSSNLLIQTDEDEFNDEISSTIYSLDQIKALLIQINSPTKKNASVRNKRVAGTVKSSATGSPRGGAALTKIKEQIALTKYDYYKSNRDILPSDIREHSEEITRMMESGMSAEEAFNEAIKLCFDQVN
jgi:hypothetical protein